MAWMVLTSIKSQFAAMQYPPQWWPAEPTLERLPQAARSPTNDGRPGIPAVPAGTASAFRLATTVIGVRRRGARGLCLLALPLSRAARSCFFCGARPQHVPGGRFPDAALPADALARAGEHPRFADPDLPDLRPAAVDLAAQGVLRQHPVQLEQAARIDGATRFQAFLPDRHAALLAGHHRHRDLLLHRRLERIRLRLTLPEQRRAS